MNPNDCIPTPGGLSKRQAVMYRELPLPAAGSTLATLISVRPYRDISVILREFVASLAMRLCRICPPHVFCMSNRLKVVWVDTAGYAAKMVNFHSIRNRAYKVLVNYTMNLELFPLELYRRISIFFVVAHPQPAPCIRLRRDQRHNAVDQWYRFCSHWDSFQSHWSGSKAMCLASPRPVSILSDGSR